MVTFGYSHKSPDSVGADDLFKTMPAILPIIRQKAEPTG